MSGTQLQGRSRLDESTGTPGRDTWRLGSLSRAPIASRQRFCAVTAVGLIILAALAGTSHAQSGNTRKSNNKVEAGVLAPGIRDPMNPQAYMQDLASRMNSRSDQGVLLGGASTPKAGSAPTGPTVPATFGTAPRVAPSQAAPREVTRSVSGTPVQPTTPRAPALSGWNVISSPGQASSYQSAPVVPNTFVPARVSAGQVPAATSVPTNTAVPAASVPTPAPATQTTAATTGQLILPVPTASASPVAPALGNQTPTGTPGQLIRDMPRASASAVVPVPGTQTPAATPGQLIRDLPTASASATAGAPGAQASAAAPNQVIRGVLTPSAPTPAPGAETATAASDQPVQDMPTIFTAVPAPANQTSTPAPGQLIRNMPRASAVLPAPGGQTPVVTSGQLVQAVPNVTGGTLAPAPQTTLIMPGQTVPLPPAVAPALIANPMAPAYPAMNSTESLYTRGPGSVERQLIAGRPGLTLWSEPGSTVGGAPAAPEPEPEGPWTLGGDLEKYRAHAVKDGSRNSGENLKKALERTGMTLGDGVNIFVLGYASDRAKPFRQNDGKGLLEEPGKVPQAAGATIGSLGVGLYSLADLLTLNALPDANTPAYKDNNPLVRPVVFAGRTIHGAWKTTEEVGNAVTWGLFDNVTGCIGLVIEDIVEVMKHAGEAVTNVARVPFHLAAGKKEHEGTDRALDWILLVPLELASNAVEMKGVANMQDYKMAFREKGVIGSVLEFGGSTYIAYRAVDKLVDKLKDEFDHNGNSNSGGNNSGGNSGGQNPPTPEFPPDTPGDIWFFWNSDGTIVMQ